MHGKWVTVNFDWAQQGILNLFLLPPHPSIQWYLAIIIKNVNELLYVVRVLIGFIQKAVDLKGYYF